MIGWICGLWMTCWVVLYVLYTPVGLAALRPLMLRVRRGAFGLGVVGLIVAGVAEGLASVPGTVVGLLALTWAVKRQWLSPRAALRLVPCSAELPPDARVALLPDGRGVPISVLQRARVAEVDGWSVVHCAISGSLAVFSARGLRAVLPHPTGFDVGSSAGVWDGVDGTSRGGTDLVQGAVGWCRAADFTGELLAGKGPVPTERSIRPVVRGARGVDDPLRVGRVVDGRWTPDPGGAAGPGTLLGRWAALARGLSPGSPAHAPGGSAP